MRKTGTGPLSQTVHGVVPTPDYLDPDEYRPTEPAHKPPSSRAQSDRYVDLAFERQYSSTSTTSTLVFDHEFDKKQRTLALNRRMASWGKN